MEIDLSQPAPKAKTLEEAQQIIDALWELLRRQQSSIAELQKKVADLEEKTRTNSKNSSTSPSQDPYRKKQISSRKTGKKRGGQKGRQGVTRPLEEGEHVVVEKCLPPNRCDCGCEVVPSKLRTRHQVVDVPPIQYTVTEYQVFDGQCLGCQKWHQGQLPAGVGYSVVGPRLMATIGTLTGGYRMSVNMTGNLLYDMFKVELSKGCISQTEAIISEAIQPITEEAHGHVKVSPVVHCDETGHKENHERQWMWVGVAGMVCVFLAMVGRGTAQAKQLLGEAFKGIIVTDRHGAYNWIDKTYRQLCWAHLLRDFTKIAERSGIAGQIGQQLLAHTKRMFHYWHLKKNGQIKQQTFERAMKLLITRFEAVLTQGAQCGESKTARTCKRLLKVRESLWLFVHHLGVEPTNNLAERTIRHYVMWRRLCLSFQSKRGSLYAQRMMTVVGSCKLQGRNVMDFMTQAINAHYGKGTRPALV
jgi:transposase